MATSGGAGTGVLDRMPRSHANDRSGLAFEPWVRLRYDPTEYRLTGA